MWHGSVATIVMSRTDHAGRTDYQPLLADLVGLVAVAAAAGVGVLAYGALPEDLVVHWTMGTGPYVGPETLAKPVALAVVPLVTAGTVALLRALPRLGGLRDALDGAQPYYDVTTALTALALVGAQVALVALNLG